MASAVRRNATYGNVAYDTRRFQQENTAPAFRRGSHLQEIPLVRPRKRTQAQVQTRVKVNLRPREEYSILPAIGFLTVALLAVLVLGGYIQLNAVYAETVTARDQLQVLQAEEERLEARYEEIFDQNTLQAAVAGSGRELSEARADQKIYVDLSEPDNAVVYDTSEGKGLLERIRQLWADLTE